MDIGYFDFGKTIKTTFGCILVTTLERWTEWVNYEVDEKMTGPSG